ncbi:MAG: protein-L-isoaspartate(D-aspartate) O-methyltransferase [Candidatus Cloacimonetes bacterium]|jgi:protein-L-isoaspartate(D-aspartate) O-methyltransferase|nr:protein-L-isoaspartate(D-aspartate) O-methyltransferase [Candidatus Cloacimonadota bacterium]MCB5286929.1 protein-L-isoaspartate(D-aspartate) O-methyltransferase [Candidatus Cloacimonadota bacterium]MCK9184129.1 protein-L-isoaspartate(D-aspartate) O-methyltransferase [Candidatus Cloacimonadota bacterium]MCK9584358.1 protein-L-isoaspartate(D-aspartate) O-methyltransferase [Candidatus Cloacimonadota bacterium]MDY0229250.1 protein-L-isoaspartate(D-aspartate) O-methyltransferase [Candidatus Cloa
MRFEDQRLRLLEDLKAGGITDAAVLSAFGDIPREDYVLPEFKEYAYRNRPLPIRAGQTISQPAMIAIMMSELKLRPSDRVLEIGTGSGYQSALLASIADELCTVELHDSLSLGAQKILRAAGFKNIYFRIGDGWAGWEKAYPAYKEFDKIIVSAAAEEVPPRLCDQLAEGGIMVLPVGGNISQILHIIVREEGTLKIRQDYPCAFVPLVKKIK